MVILAAVITIIITEALEIPAEIIEIVMVVPYNMVMISKHLRAYDILLIGPSKAGLEAG